MHPVNDRILRAANGEAEEAHLKVAHAGEEQSNTAQDVLFTSEASHQAHIKGPQHLPTPPLPHHTSERTCGAGGAARPGHRCRQPAAHRCAGSARGAPQAACRRPPALPVPPVPWCGNRHLGGGRVESRAGSRRLGAPARGRAWDRMRRRVGWGGGGSAAPAAAAGGNECQGRQARLTALYALTSINGVVCATRWGGGGQGWY